MQKIRQQNVDLLWASEPHNIHYNTSPPKKREVTVWYNSDGIILSIDYGNARGALYCSRFKADEQSLLPELVESPELPISPALQTVMDSILDYRSKYSTSQ